MLYDNGKILIDAHDVQHIMDWEGEYGLEGAFKKEMKMMGISISRDVEDITFTTDAMAMSTLHFRNKLYNYIYRKKGMSGQISDGYHTFDELYDHRMVLFAVICNANPWKAWKSKLHHDGTMYDNYFIVGIKTPEGDYSYHYHMDNWDYFKVKELDKAPKWDGHQPSDVRRLLSL